MWNAFECTFKVHGKTVVDGRGSRLEENENVLGSWKMEAIVPCFASRDCVVAGCDGYRAVIDEELFVLGMRVDGGGRSVISAGVCVE